ncbi:MAG: hypothetical protein NC318_06790 [Blautia sp.]|nr:hypothetical protein [Blautia sp.]
MEKTIQGSLGAASAFRLTEEMNALDKQSKKILRYKEVLALSAETGYPSGSR